MTLLELRAQQARRDALARLAVFCAVVLALVLLASCGPSDVEVAGTPVSGEADRVAEVRPAAASKPVLVDGDSFHRITTTTAAPTTTTTQAPTTTVPTTTTTAAPVAQTSSGCAGWGDLVAAYFPAEQVAKACSVLACESEGNPNAYNPSGASGLFQIMEKYHRSQFEAVTGRDWSAVFEPAPNVQYAADLWRRKGWQPWVCKP